MFTASPSLFSRRLLLLTAIGHAALGLLAMALCLPSMQEWAQILQTSQSKVQLSFSLFMLSFGVFQLLFGPLSDQFGRRPLLALGLAIGALGALVAGLADGINGLLLGRFIQGIGAAAGMVVGRAAAQDLFTGPERTRALAMLGVGMGLCPPLATVIGGQLHAHLGWRSVFAFCLLLALVLAVLTWRVMPSGHLRAPGARPAGLAPNALPWWRRMAGAYRALLGDLRFRNYTVVAAAGASAFFAYLAGTPLVLAQYGVGPARVGLFIMLPPLCYIVGNLLVGRLVGRVTPHQLMFAGQVCTVVGIVLSIALAQLGWHHPLAFVGPLLLMGLGHGLLMPSSLSSAIAFFPALAGAASALSGVAQQLGGALASYMVGWSVQPNATSVGTVMLGFTLLSCGSHWRAVRASRAK